MIITEAKVKMKKIEGRIKEYDLLNATTKAAQRFALGAAIDEELGLGGELAPDTAWLKKVYTRMSKIEKELDELLK